ncbi:prolactin-releasing peptide receptor-like [Octopus vulgaris]|uniref:Prolactin-releasing peptide receptor-like n=1 Tax=Octopus vulgaris TaxID=6645 RepID=A0AA36FGT3_OCTVU|nr:prolactin-releasing peptide receptor-like [Octopus vulgaris]
MLTVTYTILANFLWKRITPENENRNRDQLATRVKMKVVSMLFVIVVLFGLCWIPFTIFQLFLIHEGEYLSFSYVRSTLTWLFLQWLALAHTCVNPIIYGFMNENFRDDLKELLKESRFFPCIRSTNESSELELTEEI